MMFGARLCTIDYSNVINNERNFLKDEYDAFAFNLI